MSPQDPIAASLNSLCVAPTRKVGRGDRVAKWAETIAFALYSAHFMSEHPGGIVLPELDFLTVRTRFPAVNKFLDSMVTDFKNVFSNSSKAAARRTGDLSKLRDGGFRKPDMLGISPPGPQGIIVELVEVTTEGEASSTIKEDLQGKIDALNNFVLPILQILLEEEGRSSFAPVVIRASKWRPGPAEVAWPLLDGTTQPQPANPSIEWICFKPTFRVAPPTGIDGLILYEVHKVGVGGLVPQEVVIRLRDELRQKKMQPGPQLLPVLQRHWQLNPGDRDLLLKFGAVAAGALLVVLIIAFLPEEALAGLVIAAGRALTAALAAAVDALPAIEELAGTVLKSLPSF
jgi:hypothetical protein